MAAAGERSTFAAAWFGAAFDCAIPFLLMAGRTRTMAYALVVVFHLLTALLFPIGMFPWIMMVTATVFFAPGWPRRFMRRTESRELPTPAPSNPDPARLTPAGSDGWRSFVLPVVLAFYVAVQLSLPLRPYLGGEARGWSVRGFNFAWQVMIVEKTGFVEFFAHDMDTGRRWELSPRDYITARQATLMSLDPHMIRDLARHMAADLRGRGLENVKVTVRAHATLNGRPAQELIRPDVNLVDALPPDWIVAMKR